MSEEEIVNHNFNENHKSVMVKFDGDYSQEIEDVKASTMWSAVIEYGRDATRTALLINAGAVIAILAFYGNAILKLPVNSYCQEICGIIPGVMLGYTAGVFLAGISMVLSRQAQIQYYFAKYRQNELRAVYKYYFSAKDELYNKHANKGHKFREWALATLGASYFFFIFCSCAMYYSLI